MKHAILLKLTALAIFSALKLAMDHSSEENSGNPKSDFSEEELDLISRMYKLVGERWSLIAGRIPGRTAEEIEKYWKSKNSSSSSD